MIRPLFYEYKFPRWRVFLTEEERNRNPDWEKGITESAIYDFFTPEEQETIWRRSKNILRARGLKARLEHETED
jgi:hypothetical protein